MITKTDIIPGIRYAFQPIFDAKDGCIYGYEALIRPENDDPERFINMYEENGKLHEVEKTTFFKAIGEYKKLGCTEKLFLNSFPSDSLTEEEFRRLADEYGKELLDNLVIELLEYPEQSDEAWEIKKSFIKEHNLLLAIDDFGAGINNVDTLFSFKPDIVKLDRMLIKDIYKDDARKHLLEITVDLIRKQNILILAEGVELKEEFDYLRTLGVDYMQGYYLGRPEFTKKEGDRNVVRKSA